jgi:hypothetical protein
MIKKVFLTILIFCGLIYFNYSQAHAFDNYLTHQDPYASVYGSWAYAQSFIPSASYNSMGVKLWLRTSNTRLSLLEVAICQVNDNPIPECLKIEECPEGKTPIFSFDQVLAYGTIYASSINPIIGGNQYQVVFNDLSETINQGQEYALVFINPNATSSTFVSFYGGAGEYGEGRIYYSEDCGNRWDKNEEADLYFQLTGELPCEAATSEDMCTCTTTLTEISNVSTGASFWIDNSISLGDFLIVGLLCGIVILGVLMIFARLEIPVKIKS